MWSGKYRFTIQTSEKKNTRMRRVGIMLGKGMGMKVKGYVQCSKRIILVKIETKSKYPVIVQVYCQHQTVVMDK